MNIIGISAFYHDAACCLVKDGKLIAAVQEERFSRIKNDPSLPYLSFMYCLEKGNLQIENVDLIAYYEDPVKKRQRQLWSMDGQLNTAQLDKTQIAVVEEWIRSGLGYEGPIQCIDHHLSHAASSFYYSGFRDAAILTVDGVGEWATTTYSTADDKGISIFEEVNYPHSLGLLYSTITSYLGFEVNEGEYKVMGLAPYGRPTYMDQLEKLIRSAGNGQFELDMSFFSFGNNKKMYTGEMEALLGHPARKKGTPVQQCYMDIARSLQLKTEELLLEKVRYLYGKAHSKNLCLAGGVALNCVANGRIRKEGPFRDLFIQPAANDAGGAVGAAAEAFRQATGNRPERSPLKHAYLGPSYSNDEVLSILEASSLTFHRYDDREKLLADTAKAIDQGKVVGWFQGRMEFGPRSLGARSIIADPRDPNMRDKINAMIKKREGFRPFAPVVLEEEATRHFDLTHPSPFMLETCQVISPIPLPAITHLDNSARVQTANATDHPQITQLLHAFYTLTGCPILLNTSFNVKGEPIVCSPADAIKCFVSAGIDMLVMEDCIIHRSDNNLSTLEFILNRHNIKVNGITHSVYTFI